MIYYQIYLTENLLNGNTYIGQHKTNSLKDDDYIGSGLNLWRAVKKYGIENFRKNIIEVCETRQQADFLEIKYISFFKKGGKAEYNIADGGTGGAFHFNSHSEEAKMKISKAHTGRKWTTEQKMKLSKSCMGENNGFYGKKHSETTRGKFKQAWEIRKIDYTKEKHPMYGKHHTEESRIKMSEANKGQISYWKGKHLTEETKRKIGEKNINPSLETRLKMRNAKLGKKHSLEQRANFSKVRIGRHWYTNGEKNKFCFECPIGFYEGRTLKRNKLNNN